MKNEISAGIFQSVWLDGAIIHRASADSGDYLVSVNVPSPFGEKE